MRPEDRAASEVAQEAAATQRAGEESGAALRSLLAHSAAAVAVWDTELRCRWVNDALERYDGIPREQRLGRRPEEALAGDAAELSAIMRRVLATGECVVSREYRVPASPLLCGREGAVGLPRTVRRSVPGVLLPPGRPRHPDVLGGARRAPPPAVVGPDGGVAFPDLPHGTPLGLGMAPYEAAELELPAGSLMALYSDGLVEERHEDIDVGMRRMSQALGLPGRSLEDLSSAVIGSLPSRTLSDDATLPLARAL
ncbi:SpoIIE family protein phosphatase [Streptomyces sp. NPDC058595]|uniref:SpoIIE family protein phosphatase n=1 Tax=Streptomyces sp. NPDC058595 TaxID=3346550 RepID=UPI0036480605